VKEGGYRVAIKVLNLYAGIGGNRKLWPDKKIEVTAVEMDPQIAAIYQDFFPNDKVVVGDAHQYLLDHYNEFDFIWSSPPCPTHSKARFIGVVHGGRPYVPVYPDMSLYQEIILLKHHCKAPWCVENVIGYYTPLVQPKTMGRHYIWTNFYVSPASFKGPEIENIHGGKDAVYGFYIGDREVKNKRTLLRNLVNPEMGRHIFNSAFRNTQQRLEVDG
jgi:DNA (cytosine-5)-methyltransferase 1